MLQDIVTAFTGSEDLSPDAELSTSTSDSTTLNVVTLPICVRCEATATRHYYTTAFKMGGISYPSELRMLCQDCYDLVWSVMLESLEARIAVNMAYEQEQEARGVA